MPTVKLVPSHDSDVLVPLLRDAEEGDERIVQAIEEADTIAYLAQADDTLVGAAVVRWATDESELIYIATVPDLRGQGYGKAMVRCILDEARQRGVESVCVGTANSSLANLAFYQKCGFRIDSVRKDFFDYFPAPIYEDGILMRDMVMLRYVMADS